MIGLFSITLTYIIISLSIIASHAQIPDVCSSGSEGSLTAGPLTIRAIICSTDNKFYLDIDYPTYSGDWFGIVFSGSMIGEAVAYTTGKNGDLTEALYAYTITQKRLQGVNRMPTSIGQRNIKMHQMDYVLYTVPLT